ncbi:sensor histidine kinase [Mangrovibacterium lignilyticum]|uniref:sensor histidine kinase n=1 Tax=Mangrovibacterium lignilyticum TaxID=2668052 RepID=UPI0013D288DB|nr:HAMP domain-containing sensor histidine kinase [Mangrovibacterium lignilyticum]
MLQHSMSSSGQKEARDLNALADKYLGLSYHGLRDKDKSFNADFRLEVEDGIPKLNVVPQDIGRVLLNLTNNALCVVSETVKRRGTYGPLVVVKTLKTGNGIEIYIRDNGPGIPETVKEKIFQPFYTTKPTGKGTGLGLSLSYDIVKVHGGLIQVNSTENKGAEFTIVLPF